MTNELNEYLFDGEGNPEVIAVESEQDQAAIFLAALEEACSSHEEFVDFVTENAATMQVYGILPQEIATEASIKKVRSIFTRESRMNKAQKMAALVMARRNEDTAYKKYKKYRLLMKQEEAKILKKYGNKAKGIARKQLAGKYNAAKAIPGKIGAQIQEKIGEAIKAADSNGRNHSAIKK